MSILAAFFRDSINLQNLVELLFMDGFAAPLGLPTTRDWLPMEPTARRLALGCSFHEQLTLL